MKKLIKGISIFLILFMFCGINIKAAEPEENQKSRITHIEKLGLHITEEEKIMLQKIAIAEAGTEGIGGMAFVM